MAETRRLAAIFFSDIHGYSRQMEQDERGMLRRLEEHNQLVRLLVRHFSGRVVKTVGDAFMVEFGNCVNAVTCALEIQAGLAARNGRAAEAEAIEVRIGIHVGDVVVRDGDLFGESVNLAARMEPLAPVGAVCVSRAVFDQVRRKVSAAAVDIGERRLKNIAQPLHAYVLHPDDRRLEEALVAPGAGLLVAAPPSPDGGTVRWETVLTQGKAEAFRPEVRSDTITAVKALEEVPPPASTSSKTRRVRVPKGPLGWSRRALALAFIVGAVAAAGLFASGIFSGKPSKPVGVVSFWAVPSAVVRNGDWLLGRTPLNMTLPVGHYRFTLTNPQTGASLTKEVDVSSVSPVIVGTDFL